MRFRFNYPLVLLLIPAVIAFVLYTSGKLRRFAKWRRRSITGIRMLLFVLLLLSLSGLGISKSSDRTTTVFVVDSSDSMERSVAEAEAFISDSLRTKKSSDKAGVVSFGANAAVELTPVEKPVFNAIETKVNGNFTNMEQALKSASALIPGEDRKRMVLVGDGRENAGESLKFARILKQQNISLDVFQIKSDIGKEVQVKELSIPESLHLNESFDVSVNIASTVNTDAVLKIYADRQLLDERRIAVQSGENRFVFADKAKKGGMVTYTAVIDPETDTLNKNNSISAFTYVEDVAHILVIHDEEEAASELVKLLGSDIKTTVVKPENLPATVEELQKYDAFIISDVSAEKFDDRFLNSLETCIKHQGKGLLVTGGENSYAPGGYFKTVLEKVLPVNMDIKPKEETPNLGLMLVIDKSGSMSEGQYGVSKVELAKEAAIRSTEVLRKDDMIGVIGFDAAVQWVVKMQKPDDLKKIQDAIGTIRADGGTQILPPLEEAYLALKAANTKLKHIILLTDGQAEKSGYEPVIENIKKDGITLSTVAVGSQADIPLLAALANGGSGRFYMTDEFSDIPKIFAKETYLAGKTYLNNRTFTPSLKSNSEVLKDIKSIPSLDGYVGTTAKSTSRVIFASDQEEPVLATWQYGLGRTAAWTSDVKGMWTSRWLGWDQSPLFWKNLTSWLLQKKSRSEYSVKGSVSSGSGKLELALPPDEAVQGETVSAVVVKPSGKEEEISLSPTSPGAYLGSFDGSETGVHVVNISVKSNGETVRSITSGITIPYSPEYDIPAKDSAGLLERLAYETGGRVLKNSREVFSVEPPAVTGVIDMTAALLILLVFLLLADIALRKLNIPYNRLEQVMSMVTERSSAAASAIIRPVAAKLKDINKVSAVKTSKRASDKLQNGFEPPKIKNSAQKEKPYTADKLRSDSHISALLEKKKRREK